MCVTDEERFQEAVAVVLSREGGYVHTPSDPGGETRWGISKRSYPALDIKSLTREQAIEIYRRDWWDRLRLRKIQDLDVAAKVFDLAVNVGAWTGIVLLQRALAAAGKPVTVDGAIGPETIGAVNAIDSNVLLAALRSEAAGHYRLLIAKNPKLAVFEKGWMNRVYS